VTGIEKNLEQDTFLKIIAWIKIFTPKVDPVYRISHKSISFSE